MKTTEPPQLWLHLRTVPQVFLKAWACFCSSTRLPMKSIVSWARECDFSYFLSLSPSSINLFFCLCFQKWVCGFITLEVHAAQMVEHCAVTARSWVIFLQGSYKHEMDLYFLCHHCSEKFGTVFSIPPPPPTLNYTKEWQECLNFHFHFHFISHFITERTFTFSLSWMQVLKRVERMHEYI